MAGMRVWNDDIHLGTFYGWVRPLQNLARNNDVILLIADIQSYQNFSSWQECLKNAQRLKEILQQFVPRATVQLESELDKFQPFVQQAMDLFEGSLYKRLGTFKNSIESNGLIDIPKALYPSMMVADILCLRPEYVLAKSGFQSPHLDVVNDILLKGKKLYGWPDAVVQIMGKEDVYVPDLSGSNHMRRSDPSLSIVAESNLSSNQIMKALSKAPVPGQAGVANLAKCRVIAPLWRVVAHNDASRPDDACIQERRSCTQCKADLANRISLDLKR
jgi:tryptophanyl-tRNA synthetase